MNRKTWIGIGAACGVGLFAAGMLLGAALPEKQEKIPEQTLLFDAESCRRGADYMDEMLQRVRTQTDMNLCAAAGTTLRQAELYAFLRDALARLPEPQRKKAQMEQTAWEEEYRRRLQEPSDYEGNALASFDLSVRAGTLLYDRLRYLRAPAEAREAYEKMKNLTFTDMDRIERRLENGLFRGELRNGERDLFKLSPELCAASGDLLAGEIVCSPAGKRPYWMVVVWKGGRVKEKIAVGRDKHIESIGIADGRLRIDHTDIRGKRGTLQVAL